MANSKSTFGLEKNVASTLCYVLGWVSGLIFFLVEKEDKTIRYHALQSILFFGLISIVVMIPVVGWIISPLAMIAGFVGWIFLIVKTYQGEKVKLPIIGKIAEEKA